MKLVKSLLLGSAAGLVAVAGASAADLGVKKPTAVEYVKTCPTYGAGFFVVPGTTSCLKLIGRVRADYYVHAPVFRSSAAGNIVAGVNGPAATAFSGHKDTIRVRGYVGFDHRTATEYGLLRTYVRAYIQHQSGSTNGGSTPSGVNLEYAFIQFGGLTAGRVAPAFEHGWTQFYLTSGQNMAGGYHSDASYVNSLGYTANFGGGFSATIALDDATDRHNYGARAGHALPDVVASLAYDQSWGSLKLSGALAQHRFTSAAFSTKYGYAVEGGVKINLPFLTKGSNFWASASYSQGAVNYSGYSVFGATTVASVAYNTPDYALVAGNMKLATSWSVIGALQVYATPTVAVSVGAAYGAYDPAGADKAIKGLTVLGQVQWSPVAGFIIGAEAAYRQLTYNAGNSYVTTVAPASGSVKKSDVIGRIRFQRDF